MHINADIADTYAHHGKTDNEVYPLYPLYL